MVVGGGGGGRGWWDWLSGGYIIATLSLFVASKQPALYLYRVTRICSLSINVDTKLLFFVDVFFLKALTCKIMLAFLLPLRKVFNYQTTCSFYLH